MTAEDAKPLQATFDPGEEDEETVEGIGFEPGVKYRFAIEKPPVGKYMQYGQAKGGLFVLSKKCPADLVQQYQKHPDQFELFTAGEVNGMQALVPGKDFEKFKPFLTKTINWAWVHTTDSGQKRLIFAQMSPKPIVNPKHPEWESQIVAFARKLGAEVPEKAGIKFDSSFLHPGVTIEAEVVMVKRKGTDREYPELDFDTITLISADGEPQAQKTLSDDIDPEIKMTVLELAEGCKSAVEVIKKVKAHLKESGEKDPKVLGDYSTAITKMKDRKEILA
jgi:hypothetical protein